MRTFRHTFANTSIGVTMLLAAGCGEGSDQAEPTNFLMQPSVKTPQTLLYGNDIPKFVDQLPTFVGKRVNGSVTLNVNMQEFQQKVLPASFYASLPAPYNAGTYVWGYNINNLGPSWPGRTIEATRGTATTATDRKSVV
jgi:hypothetical protein